MTDKEFAMVQYLGTLSADPDEVLHWCRVGAVFRKDGDSPDEDAVVVGLFHDLVEDGYKTIGQLGEAWNLTDVQVAALDAITRREGEQYFTYIYRVNQNELARKVKLSDLTDNMKRCVEDLPHRWGLLRRYAKAYAILTGQWRAER